MSYVWYLSYGSNMNRERFLCYIKGLQYKNHPNPEQGCRDQSMPLDERSITIENELFFALQSSRWNNMGVGFITEKKQHGAKTFARIYKITKEQFEDVVKQENRLDVHEDLDIDYNLLRKQGSYCLFDDRFYGRLLMVDEIEGIPVYTFTINQIPKEYSKPTPYYIETIVSGIKSNFDHENELIYHAFKDLNGIRGQYDQSELKKIISNVKVS